MHTARKIGIIGQGNVGSALHRGLANAGYEVRTTGKDPAQVQEIGQWAQLTILAVPFGEREEAIRDLGTGVEGKPLVDVTNALGVGMSWIGSTTKSGAEEVQEWAQGSRVVKAFNTVFAHHMDKGNIAGEPLSAFVAGDDAGAKEAVLEMCDALGFEAIDAGPLRNTRFLEPLAYLNIDLAGKQGLGWDCGFHYVQGGVKARRGAGKQRTRARKEARGAAVGRPKGQRGAVRSAPPGQNVPRKT
jgi:predicted dinucleotide-binding enzyme